MKEQKINIKNVINTKNIVNSVKKKKGYIRIETGIDFYKKFKAICSYEHRSIRRTVLRVLQNYVSEFEKTHENFNFDEWIERR